MQSFYLRTLFLIKLLIWSKWKFNLPKKKKFLLVDGLYNPFSKYIKKKDLAILFRRGEEINFTILIKCIIKFKFTAIDYCCEYIRHVSPKLILTAFDYHSIFYKLADKTKIKTLMLQRGRRSKNDEFVKNFYKYFPKKNNEQFYVNYILLYSKKVINFYKKKIKGKYFEIGSFENNFSKPLKTNKQLRKVIFISNYNFKSSGKSENEDILAYHLSKISKKNNLKFYILPRYRKHEHLLKEEIKFYNKVIKNNCKFILNKNKTSYDILLKYRYIFTSYSTLGTELLAKGYKVGFIMYKSKKNFAWKYKFGDFEKLSNKGPFWSNFNDLNLKEINRVFNFLVNTNNFNWKKYTSFYTKQIMNYDYDNFIFKKIIKNV